MRIEKLVKKPSLSEQAYSILKKDIITGKLVPYQELPEKWVAEELGISRTPVREALARLAVESLVDFADKKVAQVASFTLQDVIDFMEIRTLLEVYNIQKVVEAATEDFIAELALNLESQKQAIQDQSYERFIDDDRKFHLLLANASRNAKLAHLIREANTGVNRAFIVLSNTLLMSAQEAYEEHMQIYTDLQDKNQEAAKTSMLFHMEQIERRIKHYYKEGETKK